MSSTTDADTDAGADGDSDLVWVAPTYHGRRHRRYHTESECQHVVEACQKRPRDELHDDFEECLWCSDHDTAQDHDEYDTNECRYCGEEYKILPVHLRSCSDIPSVDMGGGEGE